MIQRFMVLCKTFDGQQGSVVQYFSITQILYKEFFNNRKVTGDFRRFLRPRNSDYRRAQQLDALNTISGDKGKI